MIFSLDVRRARKGDCLLLHFGDEDDPGLVLIDGGPKSVYKPHLKPRLLEIKEARGLGEQDQLLVDVLMVSHVDDDHIQGLLELTNEEIVEMKASRPQLLNVQSFWHNSFDELIDHESDDITSLLASHFGTAAMAGAGNLPDSKKREVEEESKEKPEVVSSGLKVLASIEQGFRLRLNAQGLDYPPNREFGGKLIMAKKKAKAIPIAQSLTFTVIGPMQKELEELRKKHLQWLKDLKKQGKSPPEALAAYVDKSVPNLSSIVVLAELKKKRMLLTGDARGDKVLEGLELAGLIKKNGKLHVDVLKVPHHGSANNLETDFFGRITADHYVFSGNGEHGNPERESLQMLLDARGNADFEIHLTYPVKEIDVERKLDWEKEQAKEKKKKLTNSSQKVRPNWSPKKHSLTALFTDNKPFAKKVRIVEETTPHVINLFDELPF